MAVRMSIGLDTTDDIGKKTPRSKKDKTSGQKVSHIGDYEVGPAPDSIINIRLYVS